MKNDSAMRSIGTESVPKRKLRLSHVLFAATLALPATMILAWSWMPLSSIWAQNPDSLPQIQRGEPTHFPKNTNASKRDFAPRLVGELGESESPNASQRQSSSFSGTRPARLSAEYPSAENPSAQYRSISELSFREENYQVSVPYTDSDGNMSMKIETRTRRVPVRTMHYIPTNGYAGSARVPVNHNERIMQLVSQLRGVTTTDENREEVDSKLAELRKELDAEFTRMHDQQGSELDATEKRLQSLRNSHSQRGDNRPQIVQRRMDQLLGRSDPLDWNFTPPGTGSPMVSPTHSNSYANPSIVQTQNRFGSQAFQQPYSRIGSEYPNPASSSVLPPTGTQKNDPPKDWPQKRAIENTPQSPSHDLNKAFEIISKASEAVLAGKSTQTELDEITRMHKEGFITETELRQASQKNAAAEKQIDVLKLQLRSIKTDLDRDVQAAEERLAEVIERQISRKEKPSVQEQLAMSRERRSAELAVTIARENLSHFQEAMQLDNASRAGPEYSTRFASSDSINHNA